MNKTLNKNVQIHHITQLNYALHINVHTTEMHKTGTEQNASRTDQQRPKPTTENQCKTSVHQSINQSSNQKLINGRPSSSTAGSHYESRRNQDRQMLRYLTTKQ